MAGDGVSIPQTIAQMGSVAKSQAKAQPNAAQQATPFNEQLEKQEQLRVQRVKETTEAEKKKIGRENEKKDKRRERREKRQQKMLDREDEGTETGRGPDGDGEIESIGALIDTRA